ncbi:MAG: PEP/pyruvate-binding domain-containing protein [Chloroflexi bacterium]|nr:PEP/pyruvate-binding domain-containing protein [Chloroflexota bacterium]
MYIHWLGKPNCGDRSLVGGKAANLSRLAEAHRVPPGFCLTTQAYDLAMVRVEEAGRSEEGPMPDALREETAIAYRQLAVLCGEAEPGVAVRSSAADEDGAFASFAGQYETYLNVKGVEEVEKAILRCWASARSQRAREYRRQRGLAPEGGRVAVLVQHLVIADASAVAFGVNPVTGQRDEIVITASWGLGESIVGGSVTPDTYVVRKDDVAILSRETGDKGRMTVAVLGGTREVAVPLFLRERPSLEEAQVVEIARLVLDLEEKMSWAVDVECAYRGGQLYLLQCRPVTTV